MPEIVCFRRLSPFLEPGGRGQGLWVRQHVLAWIGCQSMELPTINIIQSRPVSLVLPQSPADAMIGDTDEGGVFLALLARQFDQSRDIIQAFAIDKDLPCGAESGVSGSAGCQEDIIKGTFSADEPIMVLSQAVEG